MTAVGVSFKNFYGKAALQGGTYFDPAYRASDCLAGWHVLRMRENNEDYQHLIDLIYFDHVHFSIKSLSRPYNQINRLPKQQIEEMVRVIKMATPDFFHSTLDGNGNTVHGDDVFNGKFYSL